MKLPLQDIDVQVQVHELGQELIPIEGDDRHGTPGTAGRLPCMAARVYSFSRGLHGILVAGMQHAELPPDWWDNSGCMHTITEWR
ncbi:MAG: hypothetical protein ACRER4_05520 [Steroidobacteraceae bacterium]